MIRDRIKWLLYPGINLHARLRNRILPRFFGRAAKGETRHVLDAGCGNGMLSYRSFRLGNHVLGVSVKRGEVERNRRLFHGMLGLDPDRLAFRVFDLYEIERLGLRFDEIVCSEVLEHIRGDEAVVRAFFAVLKPGGVLHLCCPNAEHPDNASHPLDREEKGGHVRPGYTEAAYRALLEPVGFGIVGLRGLGGPWRQAWNRKITRAQEKAGFLPGFLLFLLALPFLPFGKGEPDVPYSLYVRARRPEDAGGAAGRQDA